MNYKFTANLTNIHGGVIESFEFDSLCEARAKFAKVSIGGALPEVIRFDESFSHDEMCVYAEFEQPDFKNYNRMIGIIEREESNN